MDSQTGLAAWIMSALSDLPIGIKNASNTSQAIVRSTYGATVIEHGMRHAKFLDTSFQKHCLWHSLMPSVLFPNIRRSNLPQLRASLLPLARSGKKFPFASSFPFSSSQPVWQRMLVWGLKWVTANFHEIQLAGMFPGFAPERIGHRRIWRWNCNAGGWMPVAICSPASNWALPESPSNFSWIFKEFSAFLSSVFSQNIFKTVMQSLPKNSRLNWRIPAKSPTANAEG
jgi:hypothetical protein